jgi:hypothetical protein
MKPFIQKYLCTLLALTGAFTSLANAQTSVETKPPIPFNMDAFTKWNSSQPDIDPNSDKLTPNDLELLARTEQLLNQVVENSRKKLSDLAVISESELKVISEFQNQFTQYQSIGMEKDWKTKMNALKESLATKVNTAIFEGFFELARLTAIQTIERNLEDLFPIPYNSYDHHIVWLTLPYGKCQSMSCFLHLKTQSDNIHDLLKKFSESKVAIPGIIEPNTVAALYRGYARRYKRTYNNPFFFDSLKDFIKILNEKNLKNSIGGVVYISRQSAKPKKAN